MEKKKNGEGEGRKLQWRSFNGGFGEEGRKHVEEEGICETKTWKLGLKLKI